MKVFTNYCGIVYGPLSILPYAYGRVLENLRRRMKGRKAPTVGLVVGIVAGFVGVKNLKKVYCRIFSNAKKVDIVTG